jgi:YVTN family beta-propeller protein
MIKLFAITLILALTVALNADPRVGASASTGMLLVMNKGDRTLGLIDSATLRNVENIPIAGVTGHEVAAAPDGHRAFVPIYGDSGVGLPGSDGSTLVVVDLDAHKTLQTIDFGRGVRPHCAVFGPKDGLLYVTTELDNSITIIDPATLKIAGSIPTGQAESHMLALSRDGRFGYTANVGTGTISVVDIATRKTKTVIPVAQKIQRIALTPDDRWAFTSDAQKPQLAVIDTTKNTVDRWITLPSKGYGTAPTSDGKWLLVAMPDANGVAVIDLATFTVAKTISVPKAPQEVLIRPDGKVAYVSCSAGHQVAAIQLNDWSVNVIQAGAGADGLAWAK